jgi:membrane protease YdiL (CAAX protease family)
VRRYIESLPRWVELTVVITIAFGPLIFASLIDVFLPHQPGQFSDAQLSSLLVYEITILTALLGFLHLRGWTLARVGLRVTIIDTVIGVALAIAGELAFVAAYWIVASLWPQAADAMASTPLGAQQLSLPLVIVVSMVNPIFEETLVCGYVIAALKDRPDPWTGINASVAIRLLYHLYQGAVAAISIVPIGLMLGIWYARTGRLWPLIVAHALWDFLPLAGYVHW